MADSKAPTHTAFTLRLEGSRKKYGRWLETGKARQESDGIIHVFLDRLPIGGWNGYVYLAPLGAKPPDPEPEPQRPAPLPGEEEEDEHD
jgi:hypothetical protein